MSFQETIIPDNIPYEQKKVKILLVCGSRDIINFQYIFLCLDQIFETEKFDIILEGGARGVDLIAKQYAITSNIDYIEMKADWKSYPKIAGFLRNASMVRKCSKGIAIWDGASKGTQDTIDRLIKAQKLIGIFIYPKSTVILQENIEKYRKWILKEKTILIDDD